MVVQMVCYSPNLYLVVRFIHQSNRFWVTSAQIIYARGPWNQMFNTLLDILGRLCEWLDRLCSFHVSIDKLELVLSNIDSIGLPICTVYIPPFIPIPSCCQSDMGRPLQSMDWFNTKLTTVNWLLSSGIKSISEVSEWVR